MTRSAVWCSIAAAVALLAACTQRAVPPAASTASGAATAGSALTNRIWLKTSPDPPLGSMLIFLADGTLVQDSCWETYRLSRWRADGVDMLYWREDTAEIAATIVKLTEVNLTLQLDGPGGPATSTYAGATVPYVCPDMPR
jgi:hypothetical protein